MGAAALIDLLREGAGGLVAAAGFIFLIGGAIGLLRFPDVYTRAHAVLASDSLGAALVVAGLAILAWDASVSPRLGILALLLVTLGPLNAHLAANSAHAGGLTPISGRYVAPRSAKDRRSGGP